MAKDAKLWLRHDIDAQEDIKLSLVIEQLGPEGYGLFWLILETLRGQPECKYPLSLIPSLARKWNSTTEKTKAVVMSFDLFKIQDDTFFYSESLLVRVADYDKVRQRIIENGRKGGCSKALARLQQGSSKALANSSDKNRIEGNRIDTQEVSICGSGTVVPSPETKEQKLKSKRDAFAATIKPFKDLYGGEMCNAFYLYWTEPNKSGTRLKFENESTWDIARRLKRWADNSINQKTISNAGAQQDTTANERNQKILAAKGAALSPSGGSGGNIGLWKNSTSQ